MKFRFVLLLMVCVLAIGALSANADKHYVKSDSTTPTSPYTSWATASHTVQSAIDAAQSGDEIWVAGGGYPESIVLKSGVKLYGGYTGNGEERHRDIPHIYYEPATSWLQPGSSGDYIVTIPSGADAGTVLDGFLIDANYNYTQYLGGVRCEDGSSATISHNTISECPTNSNTGGGIDVGTGCSIKILANWIDGNAAVESGGGIYSAGGSVIANNVICYNGLMSWDLSTGCGLYCTTGDVVVNNTFYENYAPFYEGYSITSGGSPYIANNIIWGNYSDDTGGSSSPTFRNNIWYGYGPQPLDPTDQLADPLFVGTSNSVFHIQANSPCINAGLTSALSYLPSSAQQEDLDGNPRQAGTVDVGAYEYVDPTPPGTPVVTDDGDYTGDATRLHATWTSTAPPSGIAEYKYAIGTTPGSTNVVDWTSRGITAEVTATGLRLTTGQTYYFSVKAANGSGVWSVPGVSDGITVDTTVPIVHVWWNSPSPGAGGTWATAYHSLQDGINAAALTTPKSEVWVAAGTYAHITLVDGVAVYGGFMGSETVREQRDWNAHETVLDGGGVDSVVTAVSCASPATRIDGFTIRNGFAADHGGGICCGGGVLCNDSALTICNNFITQNTAGTESIQGQGGGIYCSWGVNPPAVILSNKITQNTAPNAYGQGGGVFCVAGCDYSTPYLITGNEIESNTGCDGGGVYCAGCSATIAGNLIRSNTSYTGGGGIRCEVCSGTTITNNRILSNTGSAEGAGINARASTLQIVSNIISENTILNPINEGGGIMLGDDEGSGGGCHGTISGNWFEANNGGGHGGAIAMHFSTGVTIQNNVFVNNTVMGAYGYGGGAIQALASGPTIVNNTFVGNKCQDASGTPTAYGGAIHIRSWGSDTPPTIVTNDVFYGNQAGTGNDVACTEGGVGVVSYCGAWPSSNPADHYYYDPISPGCLLTVGSTCLYADPLFCGGTGDCRYWLQPGSQMRSHGLNPGSGNSVPAFDKDGRPRPGADNQTDMGAYEDNPPCP